MGVSVTGPGIGRRAASAPRSAKVSPASALSASLRSLSASGVSTAARAAAGAAAWDAAGDAAKEKLEPTRLELQQSALALVNRMISLAEAPSTGEQK